MTIIQTIAGALGRAPWTEDADTRGLPGWFDVSGLAAASIAAATREAALLAGLDPSTVHADRRLAGMWFGWTLRPVGWEMPSAWHPLAGDYRAADGWIRLHTNAPQHCAAALKALGTPPERAAVAKAVAMWHANDLQEAVVAEGGCAAMMMSEAEWAVHPQGVAVGGESLIAWSAPLPESKSASRPRARPLSGVRVLDLTRVLAGPVATRWMAALGATVLRIDPADWDEDGVVPEVTAGKRCAHLDLRSDNGRATFAALLAKADVLVHGYRPGALESLGIGRDTRGGINPQLIEVSVSAWGSTGPWAARRGFDSLVQMSSGIADTGQRLEGADRPVPLPVQALDHATGCLMAAAGIRALGVRDAGGPVLSARLSLAGVAGLLAQAPLAAKPQPFEEETEADLSTHTEHTAWGPARRLRFPVAVPGLDLAFDRPACRLRSAEASWPCAD